jgi:hypothetical protein
MEPYERIPTTLYKPEDIVQAFFYIERPILFKAKIVNYFWSSYAYDFCYSVVDITTGEQVDISQRNVYGLIARKLI